MEVDELLVLVVAGLAIGALALTGLAGGSLKPIDSFFEVEVRGSGFAKAQLAELLTEREVFFLEEEDGFAELEDFFPSFKGEAAFDEGNDFVVAGDGDGA